MAVKAKTKPKAKRKRRLKWLEPKVSTVTFKGRRVEPKAAK